MSSNQKKQEKKKKDRERLVKQKILKKRTALRVERKSEREQIQAERDAHDIVHGKMMPIINNPQLLAEKEAQRAREISEKLQKNLEILKALEEEYEQEQSVRDEVNSKLESEGHSTMREKLDALHEKALQLTNKAEELAKAKEEYALQQNKNIPENSEE